MTSIPVTLPLDADGFIRRECPNCEREFKWHHGKTDDAPDVFMYPDVHWCPRCGRAAALDQWWTPLQLEYARHAAVGPMLDQLGQEFKDATRGNKFLRVDVSNNRPDVPDPLVEPDDMVMISPPCHTWEPVKVPEDANGPYYCLLCGEAYAL